MRVAVVMPWFRTLATAWAQGLRERGHTVVVVTTAMHFDPPPAHPDDVVLSHPWRSAAGLRELAAAARVLRRFDPEVVVAEAARDPRFTMLAARPGSRRPPLVLTTHDATPHDAAHAVPALRRWSAVRLLGRAAHEVTFSEFVRSAVGPRQHPVSALPLTSELVPDPMPRLVPEVVAAEGRGDFVVVGRLSPYKNLATVLAAYDAHRSSPQFRGDRLVVIGSGDPGCPVPPEVEWLDERFRFAEVAPRVAAAKASLCLYSAGSQSGVQVMSMQCGTTVLVSEVGGLGEYLPAGERPVPHDDVAALADRLGALADPQEAARRGARARTVYLQRYSPQVAAAAWEQVLDAVTPG